MSAQMEKILSFIKNNKITSILIFVGLLILVVGLISDKKAKSTALKQENESITFSNNKEVSGVLTEPKNVTVFVDVSGAVRVPGVWEIPSSSRVGEAIIKAGGFSDDANTTWIDKNLNQALPVKDGMKIYIPRVGENSPPVLGISSDADDSMTVSPSCGEGLIDINNAPLSSLVTLWGIKDKRAAAIISGRPYTSINDLMTKGNVPSNVFEAIKDKICL
ncbi:hypothetical protein COY33_02625 [candidate division WWE3 bacterium CG_4_10_14_0_2_um_filter_42_7]|uniref:Soluble ligand binding domain-containing protein n=2 Tax=Katanobacteria TaxID=422282 RepID=A0A2H0X8Q6_UNCKA|nr:MAG: hypothetical protein COT51_03515 [candidate division WWE3 bacterium CG08_land_8_20_14_0_20_41_15]PIZ42793.1 MAG: hypothetical protein COY33_02625 [candidate division WWE3 bacterium CG_4_10_14_0_2_um_filter_42_7]